MIIENENPLTQLNVKDLGAEVIWNMILELTIELVSKSNSCFIRSNNPQTIYITFNHNSNSQH
jgi:hypothetical protein